MKRIFSEMNSIKIYYHNARIHIKDIAFKYTQAEESKM